MSVGTEKGVGNAEVTRLLPFQRVQGGFSVVVLIVLVPHIIVYTLYLLCASSWFSPSCRRAWADPTFDRVSMSSPTGFSALYLTLFQ